MDKLADWINPLYLDRGVVDELRLRFLKEKQILLQDFLRKDAYLKALKLANAAAFKRERIPDQMSCGFAMSQDALLRFLSSELFSRYVELITGIRSGKNAFYIEFAAGDYTIIKDLPQSWKLATHLFITPWNDDWGGRLVFRDANGSNTFAAPLANALLLTKNRTGMRGYVEYVNHHARGRSITANV